MTLMWCPLEFEFVSSLLMDFDGHDLRLSRYERFVGQKEQSHEGTSPYRWDLGQNMVKTWPKPENSKVIFILRFAFLD